MSLDSDEELDKRLNACQGYLQLDMPDEAMEELELVPRSFHSTPEYLQIKVWVLMKKHEWKAALKVVMKLCEKHPEMPIPFLDAAYCLHEMQDTIKARDVLLTGPDDLRDYPTFHYNLACYDACLGNLDNARKHLNLAIKMDPAYRKQAEADPDLRALREMEA